LNGSIHLYLHCKNDFFGEVNTTEKTKQCNLHVKVSSGKNKKKNEVNSLVLNSSE